MDLDERKFKILQAIIDDYITTAMPVGSRTISRKEGMGLSSATIRNEMRDLEELGYLASPHASAGRVPSWRADRLDVDGNPRQLVAPFFNFSDNILGQVVGQDRRDIRALYFIYFFPQLGFRDIQQLRQFVQLRVGHAVLRRYVGHHEAGPRADENLAVAVVHDAAHGRDGDSPQPVPFGQGVVILPFYELQIGQPADQYGEDSDDDPIQIPEAAVIALFFH